MSPFLKFNKENNKNELNKKVLFNNLEKNARYLKTTFCYPRNKGLIFRELYVKSIDKKANIFFIDGMANDKNIIDHIIYPLSEDISTLKEEAKNIKNIIKAKDIKELDCFHEIIDDILIGNTIVLIEGHSVGFSVDTSKFEHRQVEKPIRENVIKGPQEGFVESSQINLSLLRKRLRNEKLITERLTIGERSKSVVEIIYIDDLANSDIVNEVKDRINEIQADTIHTIDILEQHIEERPYSLVPTVLYTERPDRVAAFLMEGHVAVLMDSSSDCLVLPVTFWSLFHTGEDMYQRWAYGNFIRIIRMISLFIALLTPSIYIAVSTFHSEMLPTDLLLAITATRERVPFPVIIEVMIMESAFELLREAGIRIPTPIGPTIGIVGALILGQAAVEANIVSPILVIIVALTGLASFAIPNNSLNFMIRISRFMFLILSSMLGAFGIMAGIAITVSYLVSVKSFGVPFLAPLAPYYPSSKDTIFRLPVWMQWIRPEHVKPKNNIRKKKPRGRSNQ
ncbi:MAG: spore germination protein [Firmicutes bacterium]|nr:spore germination protein [Bacillota bacterium]